MKEQFYKFLVENGALFAYISNLRYHKSLEEVIIKEYPKDYIDGVFLWDNKKEGYYYWKNIQLKWMEILKQNERTGNT